MFSCSYRKSFKLGNCANRTWLLCNCSQDGVVYAVEFSHRSGRDLVNMAKKRTNVIPIIEDARHPAKYRMLVGMVDVIFSDVAQPDQVCFQCAQSFFLFYGGCSNLFYMFRFNHLVYGFNIVEDFQKWFLFFLFLTIMFVL